MAEDGWRWRRTNWQIRADLAASNRDMIGEMLLSKNVRPITVATEQLLNSTMCSKEKKKVDNNVTAFPVVSRCPFCDGKAPLQREKEQVQAAADAAAKFVRRQPITYGTCADSSKSLALSRRRESRVMPVTDTSHSTSSWRHVSDIHWLRIHESSALPAIPEHALCAARADAPMQSQTRQRGPVPLAVLGR
eukprot:scaffold1220_cov259-Pinguiococcus_pyrenoidosus.AAC.124